MDRHANSVIPSIKAGKDVFVEWPMEANATKARELADLVKQHGNRHIVGLQGKYNPLCDHLREIIARGDIGKVESSTVVAHAYGGGSLPTPVDYFADKKVGGNLFTIIFSHSMEFVKQGEFPNPTVEEVKLTLGLSAWRCDAVQVIPCQPSPYCVHLRPAYR